VRVGRGDERESVASDRRVCRSRCLSRAVRNHTHAKKERDGSAAAPPPYHPASCLTAPPYPDNCVLWECAPELSLFDSARTHGRGYMAHAVTAAAATAAAASSSAVAFLLLACLLASPAHAGQGLLPPAHPVTLGKVLDPTYKGTARFNASKALVNAWTCRQTPKCASHYCGLPYVLSNSQGACVCVCVCVWTCARSGTGGARKRGDTSPAGKQLQRGVARACQKRRKSAHVGFLRQLLRRRRDALGGHVSPLSHTHAPFPLPLFTARPARPPRPLPPPSSPSLQATSGATRPTASAAPPPWPTCGPRSWLSSGSKPTASATPGTPASSAQGVGPAPWASSSPSSRKCSSCTRRCLPSTA
jgi:hypothetical protein